MSPMTPPLSEPFTTWTTSQPSMVSDDVFPDVAPPQKNKLINYADMKNGSSKKEVEAGGFNSNCLFLNI